MVLFIRSTWPLVQGCFTFGLAVFDVVFVADAVEDVDEGVDVRGAVGELDAIVCEHRMDRVGHGGDKVSEELGGRHFLGFGMKLSIGELGSSIDGNEEIEFSFSGLHFGDVDVARPWRIWTIVLPSIQKRIMHH